MASDFKVPKNALIAWLTYNQLQSGKPSHPNLQLVEFLERISISICWNRNILKLLFGKLDFGHSFKDYS